MSVSLKGVSVARAGHLVGQRDGRERRVEVDVAPDHVRDHVREGADDLLALGLRRPLERRRIVRLSAGAAAGTVAGLVAQPIGDRLGELATCPRAGLVWSPKSPVCTPLLQRREQRVLDDRRLRLSPMCRSIMSPESTRRSGWPCRGRRCPGRCRAPPRRSRCACRCWRSGRSPGRRPAPRHRSLTMSPCRLGSTTIWYCCGLSTRFMQSASMITSRCSISGKSCADRLEAVQEQPVGHLHDVGLVAAVHLLEPQLPRGLEREAAHLDRTPGPRSAACTGSRRCVSRCSTPP